MVFHDVGGGFLTHVAEMPGLELDAGAFLLVGHVAQDEAVFRAVGFHPLRFPGFGEFLIHAVLFRPFVVENVRAKAGLMVAGPGIGHQPVVPAQLIQAVVVHGFLGLIGAVGAFQVQGQSILLGGGEHGVDGVVGRLTKLGLARIGGLFAGGVHQIVGRVIAGKQMLPVRQDDIFVEIIQYFRR